GILTGQDDVSGNHQQFRALFCDPPQQRPPRLGVSVALVTRVGGSQVAVSNEIQAPGILVLKKDIWHGCCGRRILGTISLRCQAEAESKKKREILTDHLKLARGDHGIGISFWTTIYCARAKTSVRSSGCSWFPIQS